MKNSFHREKRDQKEITAKRLKLIATNTIIYEAIFKLYFKNKC